MNDTISERTQVMDKFAVFDQPITDMNRIQKVLHELRLLKMEALPLLYEKYLNGKPLSSNRKHLEMAIAYTLMARDAEHLWKSDGGKEPTKVRIERERAIALCQVSTITSAKKEKEKKVTQNKEIITETKPMPENVIVSKEAPQVLQKVKPKKVQDELSLKLKGMDLAAIHKWAKELGVTNADEIAKRHAGLAKMQLGNAIRNALKNKN